WTCFFGEDGGAGGADGGAAVAGQPHAEAVEDAGFGLIDDLGRQVFVAEAHREAREPPSERVGHDEAPPPNPHPIAMERGSSAMDRTGPWCHVWRSGMYRRCTNWPKRGPGVSNRGA